MPNLRYSWQAVVCEAITEFDAERVPERLCAADDAVFYRLLELEGDADDSEERLALEDAMEGVRLLRTNVYRFST